MNGFAPPGFTGSTIDRADNLRLEPEKVAALAGAPGARLLRLSGLDPELGQEGRLAWTSLGALPAGAEIIFLGIEDETPLFAPLVRIERTGQPAWSVFQLLEMMTPADAALWGAARSLIEWHNRHRFCANCGGATETFRAGWGRKCR